MPYDGCRGRPLRAPGCLRLTDARAYAYSIDGELEELDHVADPGSEKAPSRTADRLLQIIELELLV